MDYRNYIANITDYPKKGIIFRDVTPLFKNSEAFNSCIDELCEFAKEVGTEVIVAPESRGFILAAAMAYKLKVGIVLARKPNKLPRETISVDYALEYGVNTLTMHKDSITPGEKVLVVDDLLATGGTINACTELVNQLGGVVVGCGFIVELVDLKGRNNLINVPIKSLVTYEGE